MNGTDPRPVYIQLIDRIYTMILSSEYPPGSKIPTVRELAIILQANPNTVQKALSHIEEQGLIYTQRTTGKFVTEDKQIIDVIRDQLAKSYAEDYFEKMRRIGCDGATAVSYVSGQE